MLPVSVRASAAFLTRFSSRTIRVPVVRASWAPVLKLGNSVCRSFASQSIADTPLPTLEQLSAQFDAQFEELERSLTSTGAKQAQAAAKAAAPAAGSASGKARSSAQAVSAPAPSTAPASNDLDFNAFRPKHSRSGARPAPTPAREAEDEAELPIEPPAFGTIADNSPYFSGKTGFEADALVGPTEDYNEPMRYTKHIRSILRAYNERDLDTVLDLYYTNKVKIANALATGALLWSAFWGIIASMVTVHSVLRLWVETRCTSSAVHLVLPFAPLILCTVHIILTCCQWEYI